ncbi:MAG: OadG family protein [Synergistales bacterium]|nr:OadG family protein [Synergistales bacterium]
MSETTAAATSLSQTFDGVSGAFSISLIAFTVVFMVLIGLSLVIRGNRVLAESIEIQKKARQEMAAKKKEEEKQARAEAKKKEAEEQKTQQTAQAGDRNDEVVAAITAAVAAVSGPGARVKGIKPVSISRGWKSMARTQNLQGFDG